MTCSETPVAELSGIELADESAKIIEGLIIGGRVSEVVRLINAMDPISAVLFVTAITPGMSYEASQTLLDALGDSIGKRLLS